MNDFAFGYCTNVHAGVTLEQAKQNLQTIAAQVRSQVAPEGRLPVGLWLSENAARQLSEPSQAEEFRHWLSDKGLKAYTLNGFPQGDFHQPVVKHAVYKPTWLEDSRLQYTRQLASTLVQLLDHGQAGSISTLPLGWPDRSWNREDFQLAGKNLRSLAEHLDQLAQNTGHEVVLAVEPEPGCVLDTAIEITDFLTQFVFDDSRPYLRRHIGVCHDICHSAVMFESQGSALSQYLNSGVRIGKIQVSAAIEVPWDKVAHDDAARQAALDQLRFFNEPKYLHQTTRQSKANEPLEMVEDLGIALESWLARDTWPFSAWRIHFHVPIYIQQFGQLSATSADIAEVVKLVGQHQRATVEGARWFTGDYEVETYAWGVLPKELRMPVLADGIAKELQHFQAVLQACAG